MIRSAVDTSSPASYRPAMTPISQALPIDPPPPRTNARSPMAGIRMLASICGSPCPELDRSDAEADGRREEGVVLMGVALSRSCSAPGDDYLSRVIVGREGAPLWTLHTQGGRPAAKAAAPPPGPGYRLDRYGQGVLGSCSGVITRVVPDRQS